MKRVTLDEINQTKIWVVMGALFLTLSVLEYVGLMNPVRLSGERLVQPVQVLASRVFRTAFSPWGYLRRSIGAARRVQDLEYRYTESLAQLGELEGLREENKALLELLENSDRKLAKVVITTPILSQAVPMIAVGEVDGVRTGMTVLSGKTLIGIVGEVSHHQSQVRLLSDTLHQPVLVKTESGVQGLVVGDGKHVVLTEIPLDATVLEKERLVTVGQEGVPPDVFVGVVRSFITQEAGQVQEAHVEQFVKFYEARVLEVM